MTQHAALRKANRQSFHGTGRGGVVNQSVRTEPADTIKVFTSFQITLSYSHDFADWARQRRYSGVMMDDRPSNSRGDLDVRQMKRCVKDIERAVTQLVVGELDLLET